MLTTEEELKKYVENRVARNRNFFEHTVFDIAIEFWEIPENRTVFGSFGNLCASIAEDIIKDLEGRTWQ